MPSSPRSNNGRSRAFRDNPGAWLMATAKHRAIDHLRRNKRLERKHEELGREIEAEQGAGRARSGCRARRRHRRRPPAAHLHGLSSRAFHRGARGAHASLARRPDHRRDCARLPRSGSTIAQRIVRAKRTLAEKHVPFEVPRGAELAARLSSVLEGHLPRLQRGLHGDGRRRLDCGPRFAKMRSGSGAILAELAPQEPEVHGLVALMEIQASRARARVGPSGEPILLLDQNRALWDHLLIRRGLAALERAEGWALREWYVLQAAIAACHARARTAGRNRLGAHRRRFTTSSPRSRPRPSWS